MTKSKVRYAEEVTVVPHGSAQAKASIAAGYQMTEEAAKAIVAQWEKNPGSIPHDQYSKAQAMLVQLAATPIVVSQREGWKRSHRQPGG